MPNRDEQMQGSPTLGVTDTDLRFLGRNTLRRADGVIIETLTAFKSHCQGELLPRAQAFLRSLNFRV